MRTCKTFYTLVNETAPFHRLNAFNFASPHAMHVYLSSITPARLKDFRDITMEYPGDAYYSYDSWGQNRKSLLPAFTLLSSCPSLQNLEITAASGANAHNTIDPYRDGTYTGASHDQDLPRAMNSVRCQNLRVTRSELTPRPPYPYYPRVTTPTRGQQIQLDATRAALEAHLKAITSGPAPEIRQSDLDQARQSSGVQVHGDGRLEGELKPSLISSRTRAGTAKKDRVNADGIVEEELKKFGIDGTLLWDIQKIEDHKEVVDPETSGSKVKFLVSWALPAQKHDGNARNKSWEFLDDLSINSSTFFLIYEYYDRKNLWGEANKAQQMLDATRQALEYEKETNGGKRRRSRESAQYYVTAIESRIRQAEKKAVQAAAKDAVKAQRASDKAAETAAKAAAKTQKASARGATTSKTTKSAGQKRKRGE